MHDKLNLKTEIEQELLELKQLYVKATGTAYEPPAADKGNKSKNKSKAAGKGGAEEPEQPKQMDTRKADKARKVLHTTTRTASGVQQF